MALNAASQHHHKIETRSSAEERKPDQAENQHRQTNTDDQKHQHGRAGFGLPGFGWSLDYHTVLFCGHWCSPNL